MKLTVKVPNIICDIFGVLSVVSEETFEVHIVAHVNRVMGVFYELRFDCGWKDRREEEKNAKGIQSIINHDNEARRFFLGVDMCTQPYTGDEMHQELRAHTCTENLSNKHEHETYPDIMQSRLIQMQFSSFLFMLLLLLHFFLLPFFHRGLQPIKYFPSSFIFISSDPSYVPRTILLSLIFRLFISQFSTQHS